MSTHHAVAHVDHQSAQIIQFDAEHVEVQQLAEHAHVTRRHKSEVRSEHEFFGEVCDALEGTAEILLTGGHTSLADFKHYVHKHRALLAPRISGYEVVDQPTQNQLVALARKYFVKHDGMVGITVPT